MDRPLRIALRAGHHDTSGGNPVEYAIVGELTEAYARAFTAAGHEVRVVNPDGPDPDHEPGDGDFPGDLSAAAATVPAWAREGWVPDLYLESHTEGVANPDVRGAFVVYPDAAGDLDAEVRDALGPAIAAAIAAATTIPLRGGGVMSERATGVGRAGYRLGAFAATAALRTTTSRLLVEHGSHTSPLDLAILRSPTTADRIAEAVVAAVEQHYGAASRGFAIAPSPDPERRFFPETGQWLAYGFKEYWEREGGLPVFGYPLTPEYDTGAGATHQVFQRARLEYDQASGAIGRGLVGAELLAAQAESAGLRAELAVLHEHAAGLERDLAKAEQARLRAKEARRPKKPATEGASVQ